MCGTNFPASKHNANLLNILVHLQLLCAQCGKEFGFSWQAQSNRKLCSLMTSHYLLIQIFALSVAVWPQFHTSNSTTFWGLGWTEVVENSTNQNVEPTFLFNFYTHFGLIAPFGHNTQCGRQMTEKRGNRLKHRRPKNKTRGPIMDREHSSQQKAAETLLGTLKTRKLGVKESVYRLACSDCSQRAFYMEFSSSLKFRSRVDLESWVTNKRRSV